MAYSHVLLTGFVLLSFATLPIEALKQQASHLESNAMNEAKALPWPCLSEYGEQIIVKTKPFTKFCRVAPHGGVGTGLTEETRRKMAHLLHSAAEYTGSWFTREELLTRVGDAAANVWIETPEGEIVANSAFVNPVKEGDCTAGEIGALAVEPSYQSWGFTQYLTVLTDLALEEGYTYFYTETKVTNLRSLKLQVPLVQYNKFFFTNALRKIKGMGRKIGFVSCKRDRGKFMRKGTIDVILMSYTGSGLYNNRFTRTKNQEETCGRVIMDYLTSGDMWEEVPLADFHKEDLIKQIDIDPSTERRLGKTNQASNNAQLAGLINKYLKLE